MDEFILLKGVLRWTSSFVMKGWWDGLVHLYHKGWWDG